MFFRNVKLHNYTSKLEESGAVYRLHMTADVSSNVCEEMKWNVLDADGNVNEGMKSTKLLGLLRISDFSLTPNDKALANHALGITGLEIRNFEVASKMVDGVRVCELRFILVIGGAISKVDKFWRAVGTVDSRLEVTVIEQQMELEEEESESEGEQPEPVEEEVPAPRGRPRKKAVSIDTM